MFSMRYDGEVPDGSGNAVRTQGVCREMRLHDRNGKRRVAPALYFSLRLFFVLMRERLDVVECQNIPYFPCFACFLYCKLHGIPLVITWHEVWGPYWREYLGWKGRVGQLVEYLTTCLTCHHLAVSEMVQRDMQRLYGVPADLMPIGMELPRVDNEEASRRATYDVLFVGRLVPHKGADVLLRTMAIIERQRPGIMCGIVGDGPDKVRLRTLCSELALDDRVSFLGSVDDVYSLMRASLLLVLPSQREGFGIVVIEANACGLPVLVLDSPTSAARDLVTHGNGYACSTAEEFADRICELLADGCLRSEMGAAGVEFAQRFSWPETIARYTAFCDAAVKGVVCTSGPAA